ncbi:porin family protein [Marinigracilibium pacificum]|uniref:Porin family protein n=1 Tax=Marinigracilibium pacificum TaxID=2729599 RepID=A0A848J912_9BACT|nr:outer membrane beta-barrel protein [Marinigracilibium pacificum]NMM49542.1 porin family protein [Marinigracilibium pacificum]
MKKLLFAIAALVFINVAANAQEFKPFSVGVDLGYGIPTGDKLNGGIIFAVEPAWKFNDQLEASLRYEGAVLAGVSEDGTEVDASAIGSWLIGGRYFLNTNDFRPFAGLGLGIFNIASTTAIDENFETFEVGGTKFGFAPKVGFQFKHIRLAAEYNAVLGVEEQLGSQNYLSIKFGAVIGGGRF